LIHESLLAHPMPPATPTVPPTKAPTQAPVPAEPFRSCTLPIESIAIVTSVVSERSVKESESARRNVPWIRIAS
jgi:hypothetical protein